MAKDPADRYQQMSEMLTELMPFVDESIMPLLGRRRVATPPPRPLADAHSAQTISLAPTESRRVQRSFSPPQSTPPGQMHDQRATPELAHLSPGTPVFVQQPRSRWSSIATAAALLAALAAAAGVWTTRRDSTTSPAPAPVAATEDGRSTQSPDEALALYLAEAERLAKEGRYDRALDMIARARAVETDSAELDIRRARVADAIEIDGLRHAAEEALARGDHDAAVGAAKQVLDRAPDDPRAVSVLERAHGEVAPVAPDRESGKLFVKSNVRASVYVDDVPIGKTPIRGREVAAGDHVVELRRTGYESETKRIKVRPNRRMRVSFELEARADEEPVARAEIEREPEEQPSPDSDVTAAVEPDVTPALEPAPIVTPRAPPPPPKPSAPSVAAPRLPETHTVDSIKELTRALRVIENEAIERGKAPREIVEGVTGKLARAAYDAYAPGKTITLHPRAMYHVIVREAHAGRTTESIASKLLREHEAGRL